MLFSIAVNYIFGGLISSPAKKNFARLFLISGISANLLLLVLFKYSIFFVDNINVVCHFFSWHQIEIPAVHLPIGISFFTFQAISFLVDIYRGAAVAPKNIVQVGLYISMFPQLIAGPIVRFHDISQQLVHRVIGFDDMAMGIRKFTIGLGKKVLIANTIATTVDQIFMVPASELPFAVAWLGAVGYALQIYFDFSGYSDMAIGLGKIFGFTYLENFNYPYISRSIREFWQRWHISLSTWFRDYLYFPLGGSRCPPLHTWFNLLLVFFLCGMWHGASWNFIIWGFIHGAFIVFEKMGLQKKMKEWPSPLQHLYTLLIVICSWVFFRTENLSAAITYLKSMTGFNHGAPLKYHLLMYLNLELSIALFFGVLFSAPFSLVLYRKISNIYKDGSNALYPQQVTGVVWQLLGSLTIFAVFVFSVINLASGSYNPFIYFRF